MGSGKAAQTSLFDAAKTIYETLESLDEPTRKRVLASALSILGMDSIPAGVDLGLGGKKSEGKSGGRITTLHERPLSPVELVQQKQPSTNAQRLALFAYYREKAEGQARFSRSVLKEYFAKARLTKPQNYDRDFSSAVQLGYIYEDGAESYLTSKGLEAVEVGFGGKGEPRGVAAIKKKKPSSRRSIKRTRR